MENINQTNQWAEVEEIYRIKTTGRMIKIRFKNTMMANKAAEEGMVIVYQRIPSKHIEKELFVKITPCYNCYRYDHKTSDCKKEKQTLCAFCAGDGHHQQNCTATEPKCLNCNQKRRTLAAACPIRRELIKKKGKELRERSRSRSRNRGMTNSNVIVGSNIRNRQQHQFSGSPINNTETKELITKIVTSITFAHYMEAFQSGSFQRNMDEMFRLNGLLRVIFPENIVTEGIKDLYRDTMQNKENQCNKKETKKQKKQQKK